MHNGILIVEGSYYGEMGTEIISQLRGHHEPQEELAFNVVIKRLETDTKEPVMIELGAYWSYYSLWFLQQIPTGKSYLIEPDPNNLEVGRRNFQLNGRSGTFVSAAIGAHADPPASFKCESDGLTRPIPIESLPSFCEKFALEHVDILLADIQGAEFDMLQGASRLLDEKRVRFLLISTHHYSFSGDPLTHQHCLDFLKSKGAHIIAEHSVSESYSGDGLIVASFDPRDLDLVANISYARPRQSLFGEVEYDVARVESQRKAAELRIADLNKQIDNLTYALDSIKNSATFRFMRKIAVMDRYFPAGTRRGGLLSYVKKQLASHLS
jgi:FkbM family methyltransferase